VTLGLAGQIVRVRGNAVDDPLLADEGRQCGVVGGDVGVAAVCTDAVVGQGVLEYAFLVSQGCCR
jgi:hypothetical protein